MTGDVIEKGQKTFFLPSVQQMSLSQRWSMEKMLIGLQGDFSLEKIGTKNLLGYKIQTITAP